MLAPLGIRVDMCRSFEAMLEEVRAGAGALLLPEEAATDEHNAALAAVLAAQPPWSDLPVLILARRGADSAEAMEAVRTLGNVTLLERPVRVAALVSAVRTAIRARERQYQIREHLAERARAEDSLRLADQRKDEFLATLGHELRNPLAPLLTALHLLRTVDSADPVVAHVARVMDRQINHLVRLVDDLLEVSRITRGLIQINRGAARSCGRSCKPRSIRAGQRSMPATIDLNIDLPPEPVIVHGDAVQADAGVRQPADQCRQIHQPRRAHRRARCTGRTAARSCRCGTTASASPRTSCPPSSRCSRRSIGRAAAPRAAWASA